MWPARAGACSEGRLWISRVTDDDVDKGLRITWTWTSPDEPGDVRFETDVVRADGSTIEMTQEAIASSHLSGAAVFDPATVSADDLDAARAGVDRADPAGGGRRDGRRLHRRERGLGCRRATGHESGLTCVTASRYGDGHGPSPSRAGVPRRAHRGGRGDRAADPALDVVDLDLGQVFADWWPLIVIGVGLVALVTVPRAWVDPAWSSRSVCSSSWGPSTSSTSTSGSSGPSRSSWSGCPCSPASAVGQPRTTRSTRP